MPAQETEFIALVNETQAGLRAFIRMLGGSDEWVDDLAQETYLVAYRQFSQYDRTQNFAKWLRGIARKLIANERRKTLKHARILSGRLSGALETASECTEILETKEILRALNECLEKLPGKSSTLIRMRYQDCTNATELGKREKLSSDSIRQALMKIRQSLQVCIEAKIGEVRL